MYCAGDPNPHFCGHLSTTSTTAHLFVARNSKQFLEYFFLELFWSRFDAKLRQYKHLKVSVAISGNKRKQLIVTHIYIMVAYIEKLKCVYHQSSKAISAKRAHVRALWVDVWLLFLVCTMLMALLVLYCQLLLRPESRPVSLLGWLVGLFSHCGVSPPEEAWGPGVLLPPCSLSPSSSRGRRSTAAAPG